MSGNGSSGSVSTGRGGGSPPEAGSGAPLQCAHLGCTFTPQSETERLQLKSLSRHQKSLKVHRKHFKKDGKTCPECQVNVNSGAWKKDGQVTLADKKDYVCSHVGCDWFSTASVPASRKSSVVAHEAGFRTHKEHFRKHKESCATCAALIKKRVWLVAPRSSDDQSPAAEPVLASARCRHEGCAWSSSAATVANRKTCVNTHERSLKAHAAHISRHHENCNLCRELVESKEWPSNLGDIATGRVTAVSSKRRRASEPALSSLASLIASEARRVQLERRGINAPHSSATTDSSATASRDGSSMSPAADMSGGRPVGRARVRTGRGGGLKAARPARAGHNSSFGDFAETSAALDGGRPWTGRVMSPRGGERERDEEASHSSSNNDTTSSNGSSGKLRRKSLVAFNPLIGLLEAAENEWGGRRTGPGGSSDTSGGESATGDSGAVTGDGEATAPRSTRKRRRSKDGPAGHGGEHKGGTQAAAAAAAAAVAAAADPSVQQHPNAKRAKV